MPGEQKKIESRLVICKSAKDTGGELLEMEAAYPPNSPQPAFHYHPYQAEKFEVLSGRFRVKIGETERVYEAGEKFDVPVAVSHWMHNISDTEGRLNWQVRPALKTQDFLETMWGLSADGKTNSNGVPNLLQLAVVLNEYTDEFRAESPPYSIQRILFSILAPIGRIFGYQVKYDRYSS